MPRPAHRRSLAVSLDAVKLTLCIAVGLWLGGVAIGLSAYWLVPHWFSAPPVAAAAVAPSAPAPALQRPPPAPDSNGMFEQYQDNLQRQEQRQFEDQALSNPRNQANPKCQFWLQQNQTAPSEKSRANINQFCN
ncbi:hypothetical protein [Pseudomonas sp. nanlin1]|uniref:hypothetical protein n=1 Tax=Pseudomonas sp. nanlin1 TaxID=3040605 RepID=UPI0038911414